MILTHINPTFKSSAIPCSVVTNQIQCVCWNYLKLHPNSVPRENTKCASKDKQRKFTSATDISPEYAADGPIIKASL